MRYLGGYLILIALVVMWAQPGSSRAQAQSVPINCEEVPECGRLTNAAYEHWQAGRIKEAQHLYEQAYKRWPDAVLLYNLARVLHRAHRLKEAIAYYEQYLQSGAEGSEEHRRKAEQYKEQAQREAEISQPPSASSLPSLTGTARSAQRASPSSPPAASASHLNIAAENALPAAQPLDSSGSSGSRPVYKKWWFWTMIGTAAVGLAVGVGIGVAARQPDLSDAAHSYPF